MASFFPRQTLELRLEEIRAFRRLSLNLLEMALITGVIVRLYRSLVLTHGSGASWLYVLGTLLLGLVFVCGMATGHLANFPLRRWTWRAPLFALGVAVGEMATSLALILVGHEPTGTARAALNDWPGMAVSTLWTRELAICAWAALLAVIVTLVRRGMVAAELRDKRDREPSAGG